MLSLLDQLSRTANVDVTSNVDMVSFIVPVVALRFCKQRNVRLYFQLKNVLVLLFLSHFWERIPLF